MKKYFYYISLGFIVGIFLIIMYFVIGNFSYLLGAIIALILAIIIEKIKWEIIDSKVIYFI